MNELIQNGERELYPVKDAAYRLGVSRRTLERLVVQGRFPRPVKCGRKSLYSASDLKAYARELVATRLDNG